MHQTVPATLAIYSNSGLERSWWCGTMRMQVPFGGIRLNQLSDRLAFGDKIFQDAGRLNNGLHEAIGRCGGVLFAERP